MQRIALSVFLIWITHLLSCNESVEFKFTNAVCETYNKSWINIKNCRLKAVSRNTTTFDFYGTILHPAHNIIVTLQVLKKANGYKPWLFNYSIDACRFVKRAYNPFAIIVFNLFKEFSNINHTCPYVGPQIIKGFYLRPELLRLPFPSGDYLLAMNWIFDKRPAFSTNLYFMFTEDMF